MKTRIEIQLPTCESLSLKDKPTMKMQAQSRRRTPHVVPIFLLELAVFLAFGAFFVSTAPGAMAQDDSNPITHWDIRRNYFRRFPAAAQHGPRVPSNPQGGHDVIENQ